MAQTIYVGVVFKQILKKKSDNDKKNYDDTKKAKENTKVVNEESGSSIFKDVDKVNLKDTVRNHVFSQKHIKTGIMDLGTSQNEILDKGINIIRQVEKLGLIKEGPTQIKAYINGMQVEVKIFIKDGKLINFDMFKGWSARDMGNTIYLD